MTVMLGLDGVEDGHARPMTAQLDGERSPIWFFTAKDNAIVQNSAKETAPSQRLHRRGTIFLRPSTAAQSGQQRDH